MSNFKMQYAAYGLICTLTMLWLSMCSLTLLRCHRNSNVTGVVGSFQSPNASMTSVPEIRNLYDNWQMYPTDYKHMSH